MEYAQLNEALTEAIQVTTHGNVEWDATHFCPASALTPEEASLFRVVPLTAVDQPSFDPLAQTVIRDGCKLVEGEWRYKWRIDALSADQIEANIATRKAAALLQIDAEVDAINLAVIGSRGQEYELAEQHGLAYQSAGYTGTVPSSVSSWAAAKGWTATQAADDILATAAQWRTAQAAIRAQRLLRKEQVRVATDSAGITAAMAAWAGFVAAIRGQLGA